MSIVLALALLAPSSLALGVVGEGDAAPFRQALVRELGQRTEAPVVPVELEGDCAEPELCLERLRAAAHADQAVLVRVFAGGRARGVRGRDPASRIWEFRAAGGGGIHVYVRGEV